jgi:hypothetical protein
MGYGETRRRQKIPAYIMEYYIRKEMMLKPGRKLIRENGKNTSLVM